MKTKTVILLVICGSMLLFVGTLAMFFARGGQMLVWDQTESIGGGAMIYADETVAKEIAKMDFTYSPIPTLTVHFQGLGCHQDSLGAQLRGMKADFMVSCEIKVTGKALRAFPSGREFHGITGEDYQKRLIHEIQSRLPDDAEFQFDQHIAESTQEYFQEYPERYRQKN